MTDFRMLLRGTAAATGQLRDLARKFPGAIDIATRQQAEEMRKRIIQGIREQAPAGRPLLGLSRLTLAMRKLRGFHGTKALIHTGAYLRSITVQRAGFAAYFIGVLRSVEDARGRNAADLAAIHEYGRVIVVRVTPQMHSLLMMALRLAGELENRDRTQGGIEKVKMTERVMVIRIPARPAITPIMEDAKKNPQRIQSELRKRFAKLIGYPTGR